jgi:SulP family sulfate permease
MTTQETAPTVPAPVRRAQRIGLSRYLPFLTWLRQYRRQDLSGDLLAGCIVAIMLVPQGMAYALLAGLPAQVGLYASIVPLILYGLLGSSRYLGVGPTAVISLMVAHSLGSLAPSGGPTYVGLALVLALLVGLIYVAMGLLRLGFLVNFLSHPVLSGFTSAAAIVIACSQLKHLLGIAIPSSEAVHDLLLHAARHSNEVNLVTMGIGLTAIALLLAVPNLLGRRLQRWGVPEAVRQPIIRSGPLVTVLLSTLLVWGLGLNDGHGVAIVGRIAAGLPPLTMPPLDLTQWKALLPTALTITLVGFMESISVAKALSSKRRETLDADQELVALGVANLGAAFTGGYPAAGSLSRSAVNFSAGAKTGLASITTALLVALALLVLMPMLYYLPQAALAAIIIVAAVSLVDVTLLRRVWNYNKADAASLLITFAGVLTLGIETGIILGAFAALVLYVWRTSRPQVVILGRVGKSERYRSVRRYGNQVQTWPTVLLVRVDESLYFANTKYVGDLLRRAVADNPTVKDVVLICNAINYIDASALESLENLIEELCDAGLTLHLAEVKGPVLDQLQKVRFETHLRAGRIFDTTHEALQFLGCD